MRDMDIRQAFHDKELSAFRSEPDTLVIDEFHLLGYKDRGDKLESALIRFVGQNSNIRIIALSATMTNIEELATWISRLNNKDTYVINSIYRPVKLEKHYITYQGGGGYYARIFLNLDD